MVLRSRMVEILGTVTMASATTIVKCAATVHLNHQRVTTARRVAFAGWVGYYIVLGSVGEYDKATLISVSWKLCNEELGDPQSSPGI